MHVFVAGEEIPLPSAPRTWSCPSGAVTLVVDAMVKFVIPGGTNHGNGWAALEAACGGRNDRMKISVSPEFPLSQIIDGPNQG